MGTQGGSDPEHTSTQALEAERCAEGFEQLLGMQRLEAELCAKVLKQPVGRQRWSKGVGGHLSEKAKAEPRNGISH